jgi:hypothetical protein
MAIRATIIRAASRVAMLGGLLVAGAALAEPEAVPGGEAGVWQEHQTELAYIGFTSHYSCDGLQEKLELLLRQMGAREGWKVSTYGCDRGFGTPSRFPRATLKFSSLQPADAAAGQPAGTGAPAASAATPVMGLWRTVQLSPIHPFSLQDGDCELMEQFRDKVLPLFATREQQVKLTCVPHQDIGPFSLQMQVFAPPAPVKPR